MTAAPVLAAHRWPTNGALIADVARLGYLDGHVLDATHGLGRWWTDWTPERLTRMDSVAAKAGDVCANFLALPFRPGAFDAAAYDPPYVCVGGRKTSTIPEFLNAYGIDTTPTTPAGLRDLIAGGLAELRNAVRPGGLVVTKAMDYVWSGHLYPGAHYALTDALDLGYKLVDRLEHIGDPGPQPTNRTRKCPICRGTGWVPDDPTCRGDDCSSSGCPHCTPPGGCGGTGRVASGQQHARRNLSTLLVLRCPTDRARNHLAQGTLL